MEPNDGPVIPRPAPRLTVGEWAKRTLVWIGPRRIAASVVLAVCAGVGGWWLLHAPPPPVERSLPTTARSSVSAVPGGTQPAISGLTVPPTGALAVVHVAGAVVRPGLVRLAPTARVADAIAAAGGATSAADLDALNLAAPVVDGSRIYVPVAGEVVPVPPGQGSPAATTSSDPLDINAATAEQLDALPGIGPTTAQAIVAHRDQLGPFRTVDDLLDVRGIGPAKLEQFRALVRV